MAIQSREGSFDGLASFRNKNLITFSLSAAFASTFPQTSSHLGADGSDVWVWSSLLLALLCTLLLAFPYLARGKLPAEQRAQLSRVIWVLSVGGTALVVAFQLANAAGNLGEPSAAPVYIGIVWMIFVAALMFARLLFGPRRPSGI